MKKPALKKSPPRQRKLLLFLLQRKCFFFFFFFCSSLFSLTISNPCDRSQRFASSRPPLSSLSRRALALELDRPVRRSRGRPSARESRLPSFRFLLPAPKQMQRRIALLLAAASFAVAVAREGPARMANRPPASNETLASIEVRFLGRSVNATPAFTGAVNTALAHSVDWLSMEDLWLSPEMLLEPCAVHPPPCQRLTLRYDISPKLPPTKTAFARLIDAIHNGAIGVTLAKLGAPVEGVDLLALTVNDTTFGDRDPPLPPEAAGPLTVRFQLKIIGPDALLGGQEMFRVLLLGIASGAMAVCVCV